MEIAVLYEGIGYAAIRHTDGQRTLLNLLLVPALYLIFEDIKAIGRKIW